eukprot:TRINITY_DN67336_c12_g8_i1.p1 TRINITY_DN67336_c12_g8~~TRINITY_DN67336_c12_g8_i1.p1  ORF type:complete len:333 (-),score=40.60 TRINITY_DN67336_c12_g8_i1:363-1361(-)
MKLLLLLTALLGAVSAVQYKDYFVSTLDGLSLHVVVGGSDCAHKEAIVMLHGFPEGWSAWLEMCDYMASEGPYCCVMPDQRGYNLSSAPAAKKEYTYNKLVSDVKAVYDWLPQAGLNGGTTKAWLASHDWGGAISWVFLNQYPQYVRGLLGWNAPHPNVLLNLLQTSEAQRNASSYFLYFTMPPPIPENGLKKDNYTGLVQGVLGNASWVTPQRVHDYVSCWEQGLTGGLNWYRANLEIPPGPPGSNPMDPDRLKHIHSPMTGQYFAEVPVLLFWGKRDTALLWPQWPSETVNWITKDIQVIPLPIDHFSEHYPDMVKGYLFPWMKARSNMP